MAPLHYDNFFARISQLHLPFLSYSVILVTAFNRRQQGHIYYTCEGIIPHPTPTHYTTDATTILETVAHPALMLIRHFHLILVK
jgi:hypothetical protein